MHFQGFEGVFRDSDSCLYANRKKTWLQCAERLVSFQRSEVMTVKEIYETPVVETLSSRDLLASLGPAQANPSGRSGDVENDLTGFGGTGGTVDSR